jgi:ppGpp synthetase/RelA/SpoT-type nucleotidyltranferase
MIVPQQVRNLYNKESTNIEKTEMKVKETLINYCEENKGFAFLSRKKDLRSLAEKIETGRYKSWSQIDDLFACSIIIPTLDLEDEVIKFLTDVFEVVQIKKRGDSQKPPYEFRFDSTRFIGRLKLIPELESEINILFEVQIRSAFEHAWSVTTHALAYKTENIDWKLLRLAAQLKASVEQLDTLILGFTESASHITEHKFDEIDIKSSISKFFKDKIETQKSIPEELKPQDWSRFTDNFYNLLRAANSHREKMGVFADSALNIIDKEIAGITINEFSRSVSLLQFLIGILSKYEFLPNDLRNYSALITPELEIIFPSVQRINTVFEY